ncbi:hypothetical protein Q4488_17150 [Amphritea sp. 1_MG-2023]|uniref:hypothetical protein n=1 Tax=Amphritea sp. 1_MG-2023 TaxID=3062670 RepID=UPI0026E4054A|nr:hypothetical protein [Amphritea sp. 1_MG-2023]MDO6565106.1 hypothetical protein [Amphritea sp. 1_MG-2023]
MNLICLDLEASGLGPRSYPIEVAWKSTAGKSDNFLINPDSVSGWDFWDEYAEELHNLCRTEVCRKGVSADAACTRLNEQLAGQDVLSDAWEFDDFWLTRLFEATGQTMAFRLIGLPALLNPEELLQFQLICKGQWRQHRAMSDVDHIIEAILKVRAGEGIERSV